MVRPNVFGFRTRVRAMQFLGKFRFRALVLSLNLP